MNIKELLDDITNLIGVNLQPVNANSDSLTLLELDQNAGKYFIKPAMGKKASRNTEEFENILIDLLEFGYTSIESLLGGSSNTRQHPETILSNLPYIEHFKHKNRSYILLVDKPSHDLGTLKAASGNDLRKAKAALTAREKLSLYETHKNLKFVNELIDSSLQEIRTKYPGELKQEGISQCVNILNTLEDEFSQMFFKSHNTLKHGEYRPLSSTYGRKELVPTSSRDDEESENESEDIFENEPVNFDRKNLKIRQIVMSFSLIYDRIQYKEIELQPDFQRKERVWSQKEKSLLIESILLGLPIPMFYFAEREDGTWLIVDGLQRTTTIFDYMRGEFVLTDLKYFKDPEDSVYRKSFQDLPRQYQRKIREYQINGHLIAVEKNDFEMVRELFQRINTYGRALSAQEIRCALNPGSSIPFIRYLAETPEFVDATFGKVNDKRMKDMEYVLGVISHILFGYKDYNFNREDDFLVNTMKYLNKFNFKLNGKFSDEKPKVLPEWASSECDQLFYTLFDKFKNGLRVSQMIFGLLRFKKKSSDSLNKQLVIMLVSVFALLPKELIEKIISEKEAFINEFESLVNGDTPAFIPWISESYNEQKDKDFEYSISQSTGKKATILYRFSNFVELIKKFTGQEIIIRGIAKDAN